jgi:hypothetical protein
MALMGEKGSQIRPCPLRENTQRLHVSSSSSSSPHHTFAKLSPPFSPVLIIIIIRRRCRETAHAVFFSVVCDKDRRMTQIDYQCYSYLIRIHLLEWWRSRWPSSYTPSLKSLVSLDIHAVWGSITIPLPTLGVCVCARDGGVLSIFCFTFSHSLSLERAERITYHGMLWLSD